MRNELELIATIESYLNKQLSAEEIAAFEKRLSEDQQLQEEVILQREIMEGIEQLILKQQILQVRKKIHRVRNFTKWGLTGLSILVLIISLLYYNSKISKHRKTYNGTSLPEYNELHEEKWADADKNIAAQLFWVEASRDTVVETKGGIVLLVPANVFLDETGKRVAGKIELVVKEAIDPATIMNAGLSCESGDQLLESGGMFFVDARQDGKIVTINPASGIYIEVAADTVKPGMQLFKGKRMADGTIDWVNPQPPEHNLIPTDIQQLNFYPPRYLDSLVKWGYNVKDKKFTDSLYYSFSNLFWYTPSATSSIRWGEEEDFVDSRKKTAPDHNNYKDTVRWSRIPCGINPAKINTIWREPFQNTLLSTHEFEQRLAWIHRFGDNSLLDLYVNNLNKNLFEIDSMAAAQTVGEFKDRFLSFASQHDGKVKNQSTAIQKLRNYYTSRTHAFMESVAKTQNGFWEKQSELDDMAGRKQIQHEKDSMNRITRQFADELEVNLKDAYRQLGYDSSIIPRLPAKNVYKVQIITTGWYNVDRAVINSTVNRTTFDFTDQKTGKTATIKYLPVSFQINQPEKYDLLYVYLLPDKLNSFIRVTNTNGKYTERLNELIKYRLIIIAYKGDEAFFYSQPDIEAKAYTGIVLTKINQNDLRKKLNGKENDSQGSDIQKEMDFFLFNNLDQKRKKHNLDLQELREKVKNVIFPCSNSEGIIPK